MHTEMPRQQDAAGQPRPHAYYPPPTSPPPPPPPGVKNYMIPAILVTVLCFVPTGIAAIVYAAKVNPALQLGDFAEARRASARAKMLCWISLAVGIAFLLLIFIAAVASANSTTYYSSY